MSLAAAELTPLVVPGFLASPARARRAPGEPPLGLYVHVPFCVRKCHYCDFNSGPAPDAVRERYVEALTAEIRASPWAGSPARTVFFGGGTPSELTTAQLRRIVQALRDTFRLLPRQMAGEEAPEWTIECNPGTVSPAALEAMRAMGFDRISLGVQSFNDDHLRAIGRIHTAAEAREAVQRARAAGFGRLNLDLIFCLPGQTLAEWQADVAEAVALGPEHLSLYNLTIEERTEFGRRHRLGLLALPDEDLSADMYEWVMDFVSAAGFEQYEVSNFARPGEACRHNLIYWRQQPYLGFGVSAASYAEGLRWTATGSLQRYVSTAARAGGPERASEERLAPRAACGEALMLALRTTEGADLAAMFARYGVDPMVEWGQAIAAHVGDGLARRDGSRVLLTRRGIMLANAVCGSFL